MASEAKRALATQMVISGGRMVIYLGLLISLIELIFSCFVERS